jgi:Tfp pilus assembly protein PilN
MVRINLLPIREIIRGRELKQFLITTGLAFLGLVVAMALVYLFFSFKQGSLEVQVKSLKATLDKLKQENKEIEQLRGELTNLQKQVETIERLTRIRDTPAPFMVAVSMSIPEEVWVQTITKTGKNFMIDGVGMDNTVVVKFVENLQSVTGDKARQALGESQPPGSTAEKKDQRFFRDVKLVQIMAGGGQTGLGTVNFKIIGSLL